MTTYNSDLFSVLGHNLTNRQNRDSLRTVYNRIENNIELMKQDISRLKDITNKLLLLAQIYDIKNMEIKSLIEYSEDSNT